MISLLIIYQHTGEICDFHLFQPSESIIIHILMHWIKITLKNIYIRNQRRDRCILTSRVAIKSSFRADNRLLMIINYLGMQFSHPILPSVPSYNRRMNRIHSIKLQGDEITVNSR